MTRLSIKKQNAIIHDILGARHDLVSLAQEHQMTPEALASWADCPSVRKRLAALCALADAQTQVLLSRYRLLAASRLIRLATEESEKGGGDTARRACVDLLRLDLRRASADRVESGDPDGELARERQLLASLNPGSPTLFDGIEPCLLTHDAADLPEPPQANPPDGSR